MAHRSYDDSSRKIFVRISAIEAQLNDRQKRMVALLVSDERLTSRRCEQEFVAHKHGTIVVRAAIVK